MRIRLLLATLAVGIAVTAHADCVDGRYVVGGDPLLPGMAGNGDAVVVANGTVAIVSGCPAVPARIRRTARGTILRATWADCGTVTRVRLRMFVGSTCAEAAGYIVTRRPLSHRRFVAVKTAVCGGIAGVPCGTGEFCEHPAGSCDVADQQGLCVSIPQVCPELYRPVCGCDGVTYGNDCDRLAAQAQKAHDGECDGPKQCDGIAGLACGAGEFCEHPVGSCDVADQQGVCVTIPQLCAQFYRPVCGCDGVTYGNDCARRQAKAQKAHDGECGPRCQVTCDCYRDGTFPAWCDALACPSCGCVWACEQNVCTVHIQAPVPDPGCGPAPALAH